MEIKTKLTHLASFPLISLADIILQLLIFFLLTSTYVLEPGIRVRLPASTSAEVVSKKEIIVTITKAGELFVGEEKLSLDEFSSALEALLAQSEDKLIIVRAEKEVEVDRLVRIMDIAKSVGGERFLIATKRVE